jgi:hypothetical protein
MSQTTLLAFAVTSIGEVGTVLQYLSCIVAYVQGIVKIKNV